MGEYICCDCGRDFDYPLIIREHRGECWGMPAFEEIELCPYCESDDWRETTEEDYEDYEDEEDD